MNKKIEIAKSYFELSKIFATIAGFLAITAGFFIQITFFNLNLFNEDNNLKNVLYAGFYANLFWFFLANALLFIILSIAKWKKGKKMLDKI